MRWTRLRTPALRSGGAELIGTILQEAIDAGSGMVIFR